MIAPGDLVGGRYEVRGRLSGRAGWEVFAGRDAHLGREVVIKVPSGPSRNEEGAHELVRCARTLSRLRDARVVAVLDVGILHPAGLPYVVMEHVAPLEGRAGASLLSHLSAEDPREPIGLAARYALIADVARGVAAADRAGVHHGDLCPARIFIGLDGETPIAKVSDFGFSRAWGSGEGDVEALRYRAPETVRSGEMHRKSDIYAIGLLSHLLITGRLPFADLNDEELLRAIDAGVEAPDLLDAAALVEPRESPPAVPASEQAPGPAIPASIPPAVEIDPQFVAVIGVASTHRP